MSCRRKPFLKLTTDGGIDHSGGDEHHLLGTDRDPVPVCLTFVGSCFYGVLGFKSMEPLSFGSPVETDVVRRFLASTKAFKIYYYYYY